MIRRSRLHALIVLLVFTAVLPACQSLEAVQTPEQPTPIAIDRPVPVDIDAVVATVEARLPQPLPAAAPAIAEVTEVQLPPVADIGLQDALINVYAHANPAVVHIFVFEAIQGTALPLGTGSGFVFDEQGHIVTNNHVITEGDSFEIVFSDGSRREGTLIGTDVDSDLGVLKVEDLPEGIAPLELGESNDLQVGQFVVAIGNPFGEAGSMSIGVVSGLGRTLESQRVAEGGGRYSLPEVIQTDAAINPGNSGGPLLDLQGRVIGVNSAISTRTGTNSGVGFSIPVNAVKRIVPGVIENGAYIYPYMGIHMLSLNLELQEQLDLPRPVGAYVTDVSEGSPASEADIIGANGPGGDLIIAVDGQEIMSSDDLIAYLVFNTEVGQTINLTILRDNEEIVVPLTLGERP